jgi:hypothetical protein
MEQQFGRDFFESQRFREVEAKIINNAVSEASKTAKRELDLFKFEIVYPKVISKKEANEIEEAVIESRDRKWEEALRKADKSDFTKYLREDYLDLVQFVADEMISSYWNLFLLLIAGIREYVPYNI